MKVEDIKVTLFNVPTKEEATEIVKMISSYLSKKGRSN
jgi:hypothetical protein